MELTKQKKPVNPDDDPLSGTTGGGEDEEETGGIANMRVVNASKVERQPQLDTFPTLNDAAMYVTGPPVLPTLRKARDLSPWHVSPHAYQKVIGNGRSAGKGQISTRKKGNKGATETEGQGVTSWSSDDLRVKYRAEREREEAYQAFRLEEQVAEALDKDYGQVMRPSLLSLIYVQVGM